jgi:hypothetical protein
MNENRDVERQLKELACWAGHILVSLTAARGLPEEALENARADARSLRDSLVSLAADLHASKALVLSLE